MRYYQRFSGASTEIFYGRHRHTTQSTTDKNFQSIKINRLENIVDIDYLEIVTNKLLDSEVIEELAYPQYGAMYDGETEGVLSPACGRTMPRSSAVEL